MNDGGTVTVYADIKNTGDRAGREVVQLYVADRTGTAGRPEKELKGFCKRVRWNRARQKQLS